MKNPNENLIEIPGYDGEYLISLDGKVYSQKDPDKQPIEKSTYGSPENRRVTLWKNGSRYRPLVRTLINRTFGISEPKPAVTNTFLGWYLGTQYQLTEKEISKIINNSPAHKLL